MKFDCGLEDGDARGIDMIPLIDVVFLLLVFFIYAMLSMTVHRAIDVRLPEAVAGEQIVQDYVAVSITEDNEVYLDDVKVEPARLISSLEAKGWVDAETPISIHGDSQSQLGKAVEILDLLTNRGYRQVSLSVERQ